MDKVIKLSRDHPRLRGEHYSVLHTTRRKSGSPPPTRGTPYYKEIPVGGDRITPAYAGNTKLTAKISVQSWDHPRLRGEHDSVGEEQDRLEGSPPPTRGTREERTKSICVGRITPAYAGNTSLSLPFQPGEQDHPRLRGEHCC